MVSFFFALLAAAVVQSQWEEWLLFVNRQDFGITDPQFGTDIGFYLFQLPFLTYVVIGRSPPSSSSSSSRSLRTT